MSVRNLERLFDGFEDLWEPRIVASVNDYEVRIAKVEGDHTWHSHEDTDEFFLVLAGELTIRLRDQDPVLLGPGDCYVVRKGTEHFPQAASGTRIVLLERQGTVSTGNGPVPPGLNSTTGVRFVSED